MELSWIDQYDFSRLDLGQLSQVISEIPEKHLNFLLEGFELNQKAAEMGLVYRPGLGAGAHLSQMINQKLLDHSCIHKIKMMVSAAVDARMGGLKNPILGCAGSGNHGILFFLTIGLYFQHFAIQRPVSLSHVYAFGLMILAAIKHSFVPFYASTVGRLRPGFYAEQG
ncbi:MAG: L-serine ammonia-lyase, iron-sulfur-dependent, subunit alpha [Gammaproteobacteria bacterium]|nr:L-serine ammonia-lyase, iron-sulfur-dependent, subunit alpha [Gammaproteobacteria bacterium]